MIPTLDTDATAADTRHAWVEPMYLHLTITDPEALATLGEAAEGRERQELALTAMRIGLLSMRAARGTVDGAAIRHENERLVENLEERLGWHRQMMNEGIEGALRSYFDPQSGIFQERVQRLLCRDGELASLIGQQVTAARVSLGALFAEHLGEDSALQTLLSADERSAFFATLRAQLAQAHEAQACAIVGEFSLDRGDSALSRLVAELTVRHGDLERRIGRSVAAVVDEFSLDKKDSALSRLVGRVESTQGQISAQFSLDNPTSGLNRLVDRLDQHHRAQSVQTHEFETKVTVMLERLVTRRETARRSTLNGSDFERLVGERLGEWCEAAGDVLESVGEQTGVVPRCKVGDYLVTLGADCAAAGARIVVEAKARAAYTLRKTLDEADEARRNRAASLCLFVHSSATAPPGQIELGRWGHDIVVVWDESDPQTDMRLRVALLLAKAMCLRPTQRSGDEAASFAAVDGAVELIRKQLQGLEEIQASATTVINGGERIRGRARLIVEGIDKSVAALTTHLALLQRTLGPDD